MTEASIEALIPYNTFLRRNMIFRESEITKKEITLDNRFALPFGSVMHVVDNMSSPQQSVDVPRTEMYPFLMDNSIRKFVYHNDKLKDLDWEDIPTFPKRLYLTGLRPNLTNWNMKNKKFIRKVKVLKGNPDFENQRAYTLINHNPLYRVLSLGPSNLAQYNRFQLIFKNILKTITDLDDKNHFVFVPLVDNMNYPKSNFFGMISSDSVSNSRLTSQNHTYFFLLQLLAFLFNNNSKLSLLSKMDNNSLRRLNFVMIHGDKSLIFNVATIATMLTDRSKIWKLLGSIYAISQTSSISSDEFVKKFEKISDEPPEETPVEDDTSTDIPNPLQSGIVGGVKPKKVKAVKKDPKPKPAVRNKEIIPNDKDIRPDEIEQITEITYDTNVDTSPITTNDDESYESAPSEAEVEGVTSYVDSIRSLDTKSNSENIEDETLAFIDTYPTATPAQKGRARLLAMKHKSIIIRNSQGEAKTVAEIVDENIDTKISTEVFSSMEDKVFDKSMLSATAANFDTTYMEKLFMKDILTNILSFQMKGLFLVDYEEEDEFNEFTRIKHVKVVFEDIHGKRHTVRFKLPIPDEENYFIINGVRLSMKKQLVNLPICKISPKRVSLISNFNKTLVEKVSTRIYDLGSVFKKRVTLWNESNPKEQMELISHTGDFVSKKAPYEYKAIGVKVLSLTTPKYKLFFGIKSRFSHFKLDETKTRKFESKFGILIGKVIHSKADYIFMNNDNEILIVNIVAKNIIKRGMFIFDFVFGDQVIPEDGKRYEWCNLKILDKNIPIVFLLAYRYGLLNTLKYLGVKFRTVDKRKSLNLKPNEIPIPFADRTLIFNRYPLLHSFIMSGLRHYPTLKNYRIEELDDKDVYYQLLQDKGMSINYLKGIDNYFNFFIDPVTREVLQEMEEPTNTRDLLIRAVEMLVTKMTTQPSALKNFRIRSIEKFSAVLYNEISRQYANYLSSNFKDRGFSINTEAVFQRIVQDQTMDLKEEINPIQTMKEKSKVSFTGFGGRSAEAFVERDRKYPKDAIGILSEATPDSGNVAMVTYLSADPNIKNLRGMLNTSETKTLEPTNILSDTALLMPGATNDDPKRANFINIQLTHHVPADEAYPARVRTGYERMIAHKTSSMFIIKAKADGQIIEHHEKDKLFKVQYGKKVELYQYGKIRGEVSGSYLEHDLIITDKVKPKRRVKKGDILAYHKGFFNFDPIHDVVSWNHGVPAKVALMEKDVTLEDSCLISNDFSKKLRFKSIYPRMVRVSTDMIMKEHVKIGDEVDYESVLCKFEFEDVSSVLASGDGDDTIDELFEDLKYAEYRAKNKGIISDIQVFYTSDELTDSMKKFIQGITKGSRKRASLAKGTVQRDKYTVVNQIPPETRIRGTVLGEQDILIIFHVTTEIDCSIGDKIVLSSSLKSVVGDVERGSIETEDGIEVDVVFGASSIFKRIILSPLKTGIQSLILEKTEKDVIDEYFSE